VALVAFNIGTVEPASYRGVANIMLVFFTAHSVSAMLVLRSGAVATGKFALTTHAVDLLAAAVTLPMAGPGNPFFTFFLFVLAAAAFRWGLPETILTTIVAISLVLMYGHLASTVEFVAAFGGPTDVTVVLVRATYLAMMGLLLGYLAEAGRTLRVEAGIIVDLIGRIRTDAGLSRALTVVGQELRSVFRAADILVVLENTRQERVIRWDVSHGWSLGPAAATDAPPSRERMRYRFGPSDLSFAVAEKRLFRGASSHRFIVIGPTGQSVVPTGWHVPEDFTTTHPFRRLLSAPVHFGDEWVGRVFVIDPPADAQLVPLTQFLQALVLQVGPAVFSVHLLDQLRARAGAMERARVARELHDGVIQSLVGIEMHIDALRNSAPRGEHAMAGDLARIQALVHTEVLNLRDLMRQLRPPDFDPAELLDHLADMVQRFGRETGVGARFSTDLTDVELPRRVCFELVRIVQEGLVNVRKHSAATNVLVRFGVGDGFWTLEIADDGRGFPFDGRIAASDLDARHAGPAIIKERVHAIGGRLVIESSPGRGARLEVLVPQGVRE
jgi:signal transduction histidine kinase